MAETKPQLQPALLKSVGDDFPVLHGCQLVRNHRARHSVAYATHCKSDRYSHEIAAMHFEASLAERSNRGLIEYGVPGALQYHY
jgi:hypothetical protein